MVEVSSKYLQLSPQEEFNGWQILQALEAANHLITANLMTFCLVLDLEELDGVTDLIY